MEPKIRFKGFEGEWKTSTIGEIAPLSGGYAFQSNHFSSVGIPIVRISNILETGIVGGVFAKYATFDGDADFRLYDGDAVIAMSGATTGKVAIVHTQGFLYQNQRVGKFTKTDRVIYDFLTTIVKSHKFRANLSCLLTSSAQPNASSKDIDSITQSIPLDKDEQQAIGKYFTSLDSQISASISRLASLKQMKTASLQAMFPQEGETVPKIRFKGFEGEWKKVKLSEILTERHENSTITDSLPQLSFTIAEGVIRPEDRKSNKRDFLIKDIDNKRYLVTKVGDIIYNPANVVYGAIHRNSLMNGVVSPIYKIFTTMQDSNFIECAVRRPNFITKLAMCTEGTVTKLKTLKPEAFLNMELYITSSLEEQKLIGNYFTSLDRQISLQSQLLEKLKQIKSACLDKMFV